MEAMGNGEQVCGLGKIEKEDVNLCSKYFAGM